MTPQEIFDTVCTHLAIQGHRAVDEKTNSCTYLTKTGDKCAFGCLIPESEYTDRFEGHDNTGVFSITMGDIQYPTINSLYENNDLIGELQYAHDANYPTVHFETIKERLEHIADDYSLSKKVFNTLTFPEDWK